MTIHRNSIRKDGFTRRRFLKTAAAGVAAPWVVPGSVFGQTAPSKRVNVGVIGAGNQSRVDVPQLMRLPDVQVLAVCDVNRGSHGYARPEHFLGREPVRQKINEFYAKQKASGKYKGCDAYHDMRELLARADIDAVMLTLPDHWHALAVVMASKAGKDMYCQKPLSLTVNDGQEMIKAVRKHKRILQTGSQYRSQSRVRHFCELVRNGRVGDVKRVISFVSGAGNGPAPGWKEMPVPDGFDYQTWLGPAPQAPYHKDRCLYRFRFNLDYSGGQVTNIGAHSNDIVQWALGTDGTGPVEFEDRGSVFPPPGYLYTTATTTNFRARYANGVELICETHKPGFGVRVEGSEGWLEYQYAKITSSIESLPDSVIGPNEIHLPVSKNHYRNFIDSVKSREEPIEPVEVGHCTSTICHVGNIAMRLKRKLGWDPAKQQFIDDAEANSMLRRPYREPWTL